MQTNEQIGKTKSKWCILTDLKHDQILHEILLDGIHKSSKGPAMLEAIRNAAMGLRLYEEKGRVIPPKVLAERHQMNQQLARRLNIPNAKPRPTAGHKTIAQIEELRRRETKEQHGKVD